MQLPFDNTTQEITNAYNLNEIAHNLKVYLHIKKGMYGLAQAGRIAHDRLKNHPEKYGYQPVKFTPVPWTHKSIPISFTLIFVDFGINSVEKN